MLGSVIWGSKKCCTGNWDVNIDDINWFKNTLKNIDQFKTKMLLIIAKYNQPTTIISPQKMLKNPNPIVSMRTIVTEKNLGWNV